MQSHLVFGHNDRFLFFLTPGKMVCPLVQLGPYIREYPDFGLILGVKTCHLHE